MLNEKYSLVRLMFLQEEEDDITWWSYCKHENSNPFSEKMGDYITIKVLSQLWTVDNYCSCTYNGDITVLLKTYYFSI